MRKLLQNLLLVGLLASLLQGSVFAQEEDATEVVENYWIKSGQSLQRTEETRSSYADIEAILASEDFAHKVVKSGWRLKSSEDTETLKPIPDWLIWLVELLSIEDDSLITSAKVFEFILWCLAICAVIYLLFKYRAVITRAVRPRVRISGSELPTNLFGIEISKEQLPQDIVGTAQVMWSDGNSRNALAMLLRGSIVSLVNTLDLNLRDSDTERECCEKIESSAEPRISGFMWRLVAVWQRLAYAHEPPEQAVFQELCQKYRQVFE
ncbi:MAG: DUF4129 domain-containing protein [Pseudomonadota bacterium]